MEKEIKLGNLILVVLSFGTGVLFWDTIQNQLGEEAIQFSTLGLIGFVLSIIFGGASLVLAIVAIHLGKSSEKVLSDRSDKSIELQNKTHEKTIEALQKIASSTAVTEKRMEDMIAGRVRNALSDHQYLRKGANPDKIEELIRQSISDQGNSEKIQKRRIEDERDKKKYSEYRDQILHSMANNKKNQVLKLDEGSVHGKGLDLVDGLFIVNEEKIGVCVFYKAPKYSRLFDKEDIAEFSENVAEGISNGEFSKIYIISNEEFEITKEIKSAIESKRPIYKNEVFESIKIIINKNPAEVIEEII